MNDLVDQMFPPVHARWAPEYTDFNFWRATPIANIELPDLGPPSPTLSARSDTSGRLSVLRNFSLRGSRASSPVVSEANTHDKNESGSPRPSSPLVRPSWSSDSEMSEGEDLDGNNGERRRRSRANSMPGSLPGSMEDSFFDDPRFDLDHDGIKRDRRDGDEDVLEDDDNENGEGDGREDDAPLEEGDAEDDELLFEDDLDAAVEVGLCHSFCPLSVLTQLLFLRCPRSPSNAHGALPAVSVSSPGSFCFPFRHSSLYVFNERLVVSVIRAW